MQHKPYNCPAPGMLGPAPAPAQVDGDDLAVMRNRGGHARPLRRPRDLLDQLDRFRRAVDGAAGDGMDTLYRRAFDVLTSSKLVEALDVSGRTRGSATATAGARRSTSATAPRCGTTSS